MISYCAKCKYNDSKEDTYKHSSSEGSEGDDFYGSKMYKTK